VLAKVSIGLTASCKLQAASCKPAYAAAAKLHKLQLQAASCKAVCDLETFAVNRYPLNLAACRLARS